MDNEQFIENVDTQIIEKTELSTVNPDKHHINIHNDPGLFREFINLVERISQIISEEGEFEDDRPVFTKEFKDWFERLTTKMYRPC